MPFLTGLISFYLVFWGISSFAFRPELSVGSTKAAMAAGCMFVLIGIAHFIRRYMIEGIMKGMTQYARLLNYVSGALEIILGVGLFFTATRLISSIGLILLLIAVFPANINHARISPSRKNVVRLYFQPVYILWMWWASGWYWPF
jgi:uncharacterized membrane protein